MLGLYSVLWGKTEEKRLVNDEEKQNTLRQNLLLAETEDRETDNIKSDIP